MFQNVPPGSSNILDAHPMAGEKQVSSRRIMVTLAAAAIMMLSIPIALAGSPMRIIWRVGKWF